VIVVVSGVEAERRWIPTRKRAKSAGPGTGPPPVDVHRLTVIDAEPAADEATAAAWLKEGAEASVETALGYLNRAVAAARVSSFDPSVTEVRREHALAVRAGYGEGEAVAEGRWAEALELPTPKAKPSGLSPQERTAALLSARDVALACEELSIRADADVRAGRRREAALQLRAALDAAVVELQSFSTLSGMADRIAELEGLHAEVSDIADAATQGGLDDVQYERVTAALGRLQAALRARLAATGL
jgi:hypothetical protein